MRTRQVAFIRAVMVGREGLDRETLLNIFADAGAVDSLSHLATGNVSFDADPRELEELTDQVDAALSAVVGRAIEIFVRSIDDLRSIDAAAIFGRAPDAPVRDMVVTFFHEPPELSQWQLPHWIKNGRVAVFEVDRREVYSITRLVDGQTAAPGGVLEKTTGQRATSRAWGTVEKILAKHPV